MDYVVYGTGYGATLMLLGYALRTWGPKWRFRDVDERAYASEELNSARSAWARFMTGLGAVIATCGVVLILFTFVLMLANPGDNVSRMVSLVLSGILLVAVAAWAWLYFSRFGGYGVVRVPQALSVQTTQPLRYDNRQERADADQTPERANMLRNHDHDHDQDDEFDVEVIDEEFYEPDEDEVARMEVHSSRFETHHPDIDEVAPESLTAEIVDPGDDAEARSGEIVAVEGAEPSRDDDVENGAPGDQGDALSDYDDADGVEADGAFVEEPVEPKAIGADDAGHETANAADAEETLTASLTDASARTTPGGRDDALRRLRERKANRTRQSDDA